MNYFVTHLEREGNNYIQEVFTFFDFEEFKIFKIVFEMKF